MNIELSLKFLLLVVLFLIACFFYYAGLERGKRIAEQALPSCLYVARPAGSPKPFGCDLKEGVDVKADLIVGGGYFISLEQWKTP